jgi:hypothetical protein
VKPIPGGTFTIPEGGPERLDAIVGGDSGPLWAFMVATGGLGVSIQELFALLDCPMDAGPMLGEWAVEYHGDDFEAGRVYTVTAEFLDVREKEGRSGRFDLARMRAEIAGAATVDFTYVLPRR